ncbi:MAG TPA: hypothetical protein V6D03_01055 [Candidatus Caenarcaniphilales bacterium]
MKDLQLNPSGLELATPSFKLEAPEAELEKSSTAFRLFNSDRVRLSRMGIARSSLLLPIALSIDLTHTEGKSGIAPWVRDLALVSSCTWIHSPTCLYWWSSLNDEAGWELAQRQLACLASE